MCFAIFILFCFCALCFFIIILSSQLFLWKLINIAFKVKQFKGLRALSQLSLCTSNPPTTQRLQRLLESLHPIVIIFLAPWLHCSICIEQERAGLEGLWVSYGSDSGIFLSLGPITTYRQPELFALKHVSALLHSDKFPCASVRGLSLHAADYFQFIYFILFCYGTVWDKVLRDEEEFYFLTLLMCRCQGS